MESELVSDSFSIKNKEVANSTSFEEIFEKHLPYYMAMGMSYNEFWYKDVSLVKTYRKLDRLNRQRKNNELWLLGRYVYEAILDNVPILRPLSKAKEPIPYLKEPFPILKETKEEKIEKEKAEFDTMKSKMFAFMNKHNNKKGGT